MHEQRQHRLPESWVAGRPNSLTVAVVKRCVVGCRHDRAMVIRGDKFSGKPGDWADVKTEIVSAIETASYSYITKMGAHL